MLRYRTSAYSIHAKCVCIQTNILRLNKRDEVTKETAEGTKAVTVTTEVAARVEVAGTTEVIARAEVVVVGRNVWR
ncbi:hypothetical protein Droror1_Dr00013514 [Drosera rotundifolia]